MTLRTKSRCKHSSAPSVPDAKALRGAELWDSLSEELLRVVFGHLEEDVSALIALRCSSKALGRLVTPQLEKLSAKLSNDGLRNCAKTCPNLRELAIRHFSPVTDISPLERLTQLSKLSCPFTNTLSTTREVCRLPESLVVFDLRGTHIGSRGVLALNLPQLRVLDIRDTDVLRGYDVIDLLSGCVNLEMLGLSALQRCIDHIWSPLRTFPKLRDLRISHARFFRGLEAGGAPTQLERLELSFSEAPPAALESMLRQLPGLKRLTLDVVATALHAAAAHEVLEELQLFVPLLAPDGLSFPALKRLWIRPLNHAGGRFIPSLAAMEGLRSLAIVDAYLSSRDDSPLGPVLVGLPLTDLTLVRCGEEVELSALEHLAECRHLERLAVVHHHSDAEWSCGRKKIVEAALCKAPRLQLLVGQGSITNTARHSEDWVAVACSAKTLDPNLKAFARHGGVWSCFTRKH